MGIGRFFKKILTGSSYDRLSEQYTPKDFDPVIEKALKELTAGRTYWYNLKATESKTFYDDVLTLPDKEKVVFIMQQMERLHEWSKLSNRFVDGTEEKKQVRKAFVQQLFRNKLELDTEDIALLADGFVRYKGSDYNNVLGWPVKSFVTIIQKKYKCETVPPEVKDALLILLAVIDATKKNVYLGKDATKLSEQISEILFIPTENTAAIKPVFFLGDDDFAVYANEMITGLPEEEKPYWYRLIAFCQKATGSKPSKKYLDEGLILINALGTVHFQTMLKNWFSFIVKLKEKLVQQGYGYVFIVDINSECLKGFIWLCANFNEPELLQAIAAVADRAYRKIPGIGQTATLIGNACVYTLYKSDGLEGISHLSRLKLRAKHPSTQTLIQKYIETAAKERNVATDTIEDLAVDDFGLVNGERIFELESYKAVLKIEKIGKVSLNWYKSDGTPQKTDPAIVKEKQGEQLKKIKDTVKQIEAALTTQRDRLDLSFRTGRKMDWPHFVAYYLEHELVTGIVKKLIWRFENEESTIDAIRIDENWANNIDEVVSPGEGFSVSLWHPATDTLENVRQWRSFLIEKEIQQPLKQAFREIYLLTDAEVNTRSYSNRMAGHILKQHQFNSLAKIRGWRYSLQGNFDNGSDGTAELKLPGYQLIAEYWTNAIQTDATDVGIFNYVATDQVRFKNMQTRDVIDLAQVPVVAFSEVMRDVDLFVGVASVGNDSEWRDNGGMPAYRDYWQSYAFGELNEMSKNRKQILERLLPRLKIAKVAEMRDKFLVVKGKKRTYKIHLGSTNILMEPNDQYLCIVPDRSQKSYAENVFLPFEGDTGLSIIISKAFLLVDDDKITDTTITRQIG